ncbi:MAG: hypothetical protein AAF458_03570 [Pseudomonadota bacterium]
MSVIAEANSSDLFAVPPEPFGVVVGPDGLVYFCDVSNHRIFKVDTFGVVSVVAGSGEPGNDGDGLAAAAARVTQPYELRFDSAGNLYFVDMIAHVVRRVLAADGTIETLAGTGIEGFAGDGGAGTSAQLARPHSIELDGRGRLFIADIANHRVRALDLNSGVIETFAGTGEQLPTRVGEALPGNPVYGPRAVAFEANGDMVLGLREGNAIYRLAALTQTIAHVAGTGNMGYSGDGEDARLAELAGPKGIALGLNGDIIIADTESHTVRRIDAGGVITTLAGNGEKGDSLDPGKACLARPHGVFVEPSGAVLIGDSDNRRLLRLSD